MIIYKKVLSLFIFSFVKPDCNFYEHFVKSAIILTCAPVVLCIFYEFSTKKYQFFKGLIYVCAPFISIAAKKIGFRRFVSNEFATFVNLRVYEFATFVITPPRELFWSTPWINYVSLSKMHTIGPPTNNNTKIVISVLAIINSIMIMYYYNKQSNVLSFIHKTRRAVKRVARLRGFSCAIYKLYRFMDAASKSYRSSAPPPCPSLSFKTCKNYGKRGKHGKSLLCVYLCDCLSMCAFGRFVVMLLTINKYIILHKCVNLPKTWC